jgi:hypothetical protein
MREHRKYRFGRSDRSPRQEDDEQRKTTQEADAKRKEAEDKEATDHARRGRSTMFFLKNEQTQNFSAPVRNAIQSGPLRQRVENYLNMAQDHALNLPAQEMIALIVHGIELMREQDKFIDGRKKQLTEMEKMNANEKTRIISACEELPPERRPNLDDFFGETRHRVSSPMGAPFMMHMQNGSSFMKNKSPAPGPGLEIPSQTNPMSDGPLYKTEMVEQAHFGGTQQAQTTSGIPQQFEHQNGGADGQQQSLPVTSTLLYSAPAPVISSSQPGASLAPPNFGLPPPMAASSFSSEVPTSSSTFGLSATSRPDNMQNQFAQSSQPTTQLTLRSLLPPLAGTGSARLPDLSQPPPGVPSSATISAMPNLSLPPPNFAMADLTIPPPNMGAPPPTLSSVTRLALNTLAAAPLPAAKGPVPLMSITQPLPLGSTGGLPGGLQLGGRNANSSGNAQQNRNFLRGAGRGSAGRAGRAVSLQLNKQQQDRSVANDKSPAPPEVSQGAEEGRQGTPVDTSLNATMASSPANSAQSNKNESLAVEPTPS